MRHILIKLVYGTWLREGQVKNIVLCLDKQSFDREQRNLLTRQRRTVGGALRKRQKRRMGFSRQRHIPRLGYETPQPQEWRDFQSKRQNRDKVLSALCAGFNEVLADVSKAEKEGGETLGMVLAAMNGLQKMVDGDGEPIVHIHIRRWGEGVAGRSPVVAVVKKIMMPARIELMSMSTDAWVIMRLG